MINDLAEMFSRTIRPQDKLLLLPVYDAGGTATRDINSDILLEKISNCNVELIASIEDARKRLIEISPSVEAVVTAGARDPQLPVLAKQIHNYLKQKEKNNV
jgi:UDP-N-acetylmuramate-alanine ligase